jgi:hypothetical protein
MVERTTVTRGEIVSEPAHVLVWLVAETNSGRKAPDIEDSDRLLPEPEVSPLLTPIERQTRIVHELAGCQVGRLLAV